jgi:hypothetical protein
VCVVLEVCFHAIVFDARVETTTTTPKTIGVLVVVLFWLESHLRIAFIEYFLQFSLYTSRQYSHFKRFLSKTSVVLVVVT